MDITDLILADHHEQRRAFARLDDTPKDDVESLGFLWNDLAHFLEVHAAAEEAVFYPELLRVADEDGEETKDAIGDHNDIRDGIREAAEHEVGSDGWWKGVWKARESNTEHMGEEEDEGLASFRQAASLEKRAELGKLFQVAKTRPVEKLLDTSDKDPDEYVKNAP